jgi:hypothetical protein
MAPLLPTTGTATRNSLSRLGRIPVEAAAGAVLGLDYARQRPAWPAFDAAVEP